MRKGQSKRVTLQQKYKIQKRVKEYKRKLKKAGKTIGPNGGQWKSKKESNIPNDWPFKDQMLADIERQKAAEAELNEKNKIARKLAAEKKKRDAAAGKTTTPVESSLPRGMGAPIPPTFAATNAIMLDAYTKRVWREVKQVIEESDVVLEVLDARDPLGSRCLELEQWAHGKLLERQAKRAAGEVEPAPKPIILVLNKVDLVPVSVSQAWLDFFAKHDATFPCIAFHSHRALESPALKGQVVSPKDVCAGADALWQLINNLHAEATAASGESKPLKVGIIGYGNVGKSSVLNTLARTHAVGVGSVAGYTKELTRFKLSKGIYAIDSPAVPSKPEAPGPHIELPLSNNRIKDDVASWLQHFDPVNLQSVLALPAFETFDEFLTSLAKKVNIMKGAELNLVLAARTLLKDWNSGKIKYFTAPPEIDDEEEEEEEEEEEQPKPKGKKAQAAAAAAAAEKKKQKEEAKKQEPTGLAAFFAASNRQTLVALKKAGTIAPEASYLVVEGNLFDQGEEAESDEDDGEEQEGEEDEEMDGEDDDGEQMEDDEEEEEEEVAPPPPPAKKGAKGAKAAAAAAPVAAPAAKGKKAAAAAPAPVAAASAAVSNKKKPAVAAPAPVPVAAAASRKRKPEPESEEDEAEPEVAAKPAPAQRAAPVVKKQATASKAGSSKPTPVAADKPKAAAAASGKKKAGK